MRHNLCFFLKIYPGFAQTGNNRLKSDKKIIRQSTESEDDFEYHWVQIQLKNVKKLSLSCRKGGLSSSLMNSLDTSFTSV